MSDEVVKTDAHYSLLVTHYSCSLLITHYSSLITHHSLLIAHYSSRLITHHDSLLTTHDSSFITTLRDLFRRIRRRPVARKERPRLDIDVLRSLLRAVVSALRGM